jgi:hypothetical protein
MIRPHASSVRQPDAPDSLDIYPHDLNEDTTRQLTLARIPSGDSMSPHLHEPIEHALRPLFDALPVNRAMDHLRVNGEGAGPHAELIGRLLEDPALKDKPTLEAGLWLYVDDLKRSHEVSQKLHRPSGSFWHAIMHRREGDYSNSHHWYRKAGQHPVLHRIDSGGGGAGAGTAIGAYEPHAFIDRVERAAAQKSDSPDLVAMQRLEWVALFEWCVEHH